MTRKHVNTTETIRGTARKIQRDAIVIDMANSSKLTRSYALKLKKAGVHGVIFTIAGATLGGFDIHRGKTDEGERNLKRLRGFTVENSDLTLLGTEPESFQEAKGLGKVAIMAAFQNSMPFLRDHKVLHRMVEDGLRLVQLTYNAKNEVGCGCQVAPDTGLTEFGKTLVGYLNDEGVAIDLSHVGDNTTIDAIRASRDPVMFTHANARRLCHHPRNKPDELLIALQAKGGIVGLNAFPAFISDKPPATVSKLLDHADYIRNLCGSSALGIGPDLIEGWTWKEKKEVRKAFPDWGRRLLYPSGMNTITKIVNLAAGLLRRGFSQKDVSMILGENFLRVFCTIRG